MNAEDPDHPGELPRGRIDHSLEELLREAEETVADLRTELQRRRGQNHREDLAAQHVEIDRLTRHLENAELRWQDIRDFLVALTAELRRDQQ